MVLVSIPSRRGEDGSQQGGISSQFYQTGKQRKTNIGVAETSPTAIGSLPTKRERLRKAKRQRQRKGEKTTLIPVSNSSQNKTADKEAENIEKLDVACLWGSAVLVGNI